MFLRVSTRRVTALLLALIAAFSAAQTLSVIPASVSADNNLTFQLSRTLTSTEPTDASATIEVNLQTGQTHIQIRGATSNAAYVVGFVSTSANMQVATISTDNDGNGELDVSLGTGSYVGHFEISRLGIAQFTSSDTSFIIGASVSTSVSTSASTTTSTGEISANATGQVLFQVDPLSVSVNAGDIAKFNINVVAPQTIASVLLSARGIPNDSSMIAIFTPALGTANPEFHSSMTVVTSADTPIGDYGITVMALVNGEEYNSQVTLTVVGSSTTSQKTTVTVPASAALTISLETDTHVYQSNATVDLRGHVVDATGNAVAGASVSIQVDSAIGTEAFSQSDLSTDLAGVFHVSFELTANSTAGTYTAFASTSKTGYKGATTHTTFVVETSSTPSVVITDVYATDTNGVRSAVFTAGQTVLIWVVVQNSGAPFQGVIWVQVRDPNGTPVSIQLQISTLDTGAIVKVAFGFTIMSSLTLGVYAANALVSDKLISQGGTFFASGSAEFAVTG
jgi:hypothetical protein